jgi:hypothetical protein
MKNPITLSGLAALALLGATCMGGCATHKSLVEEASRGPVIINPHSAPDKIELNRFLQARQPQQFLADIKDFSAPVTEARLQLANTGIVVPLERVGGTTWRGELSSQQIKQLAISGKTIQYEGRVIARDQNGVVGTSKDPVQIAIAAPAFVPDSG